MALSLPPLCDERTGGETELRDIADDCVDEFLRNRVHGETAATEKDARADTWEELGGMNEVKRGEE